MFGSISTSIQLVKESFSVLSKDKEILLFPVVSGIFTMLLLVSFIVPLFVLGLNESLTPLLYVALFVFYVLSYFIIIFFNSALVTCAHIRFNGGDPTFMDGINNALKHVRSIFVWAVISATVGMILRVIAGNQRKNLIGSILASLIGMAWTMLTFFVIPIIVIENSGTLEAIGKSGTLLKGTWGENIVGSASMGFVFVLLAALGVLAFIPVLMFGGAAFGAIGFVALIGYFIILGIIKSSLNGIFIAALYNYARNKNVSGLYSQGLIEGAFRQK